MLNTHRRTAFVLSIFLTTLLISHTYAKCSTPPRGWICAAEAYDARDACDCNCGIYDPDCDVPDLALRSCQAGQFCGYNATCASCINPLSSDRGKYLPLTTNSYGLCKVQCTTGSTGASCDRRSAPPQTWTCAPSNYNAGDGCHCRCGAPDPDCDNDTPVAIEGCDVGHYCHPVSAECTACRNTPEQGEYKADGNKGFAVSQLGMCQVDCEGTVGGWSCNDYCLMDACEVVSYDQMAKCLSQMPFSDDSRKSTLQSLKYGLGMFVFKDIINSPPDAQNFPDKVDLDALLKPLESMEFRSDNDFQEELATSFIPLYDAHTLYIKPSSYRDIFFTLPINLVSVAEKSNGVPKNVIYISSVVSLPGWENIHPEVKVDHLVGVRVDSIDGQDAVEYIQAFADGIAGLSKDPGSRYNIAMSGTFVMRSLIVRSMPKNDALRIRFTNMTSMETEMIDLPWVGYTRKKIPSHEFLSAQYGLTQNPARRSDQKWHSELIEEIAPHAEEFFGKSGKIQKLRSRSMQSKSLEYIVSEQDVKLIRVKPGVGVLKISTFHPSNLNSFRYAIVDALAKAQDYGLEQLMIDFRGNGGGYICLGYALLAYLFPDMHLYNLYDVLHHPSFVALAEKAAVVDLDGETMWSFTHWADAQGKPFTSADWINNPREIQWGDSSSTYTHPFHDNCADFLREWPAPRMIKYAPSNVMVVTDGYCGSTCAVFSLALQESGKARTLVYGGRTGQPQMVGSFPGGQVYNLAYLSEDFQFLNLSDSSTAPPSFPNSAGFSFTIREIYSRQPKYSHVPLEYVWNPSHFRADYSLESAISDAAYYESASLFFDVCISGETRPCSISHGAGQRQCGKDGTFSQECQVASCNDGYIMSVGSCVQDDDPMTWRDYFAFASIYLFGIIFVVFIYKRWKERPDNLRERFVKLMNLPNSYAMVDLSRDGILGEDMSDASEEHPPA